jgi:hypothetical protein
LRGISIPDQLTDEQKTQVHRLLKQYNPEFLTSHPIVNADGKPISLKIDLNSVTDFMFGSHLELNVHQKASISAMFEDYPAHLKWSNEHMEVRQVKAGDVPEHEAKLEGADGLFVKKDMKKDTFVLMFDGMFLDNQKDKENDKKLRKLAECDNYFAKAVSQEGHILEGMGASMKLNAATEPDSIYAFDHTRSNLDALGINANHAETNEKLKFILFKTNRDVIKEEQLCFKYFIDSVR